MQAILTYLSLAFNSIILTAIPVTRLWGLLGWAILGWMYPSRPSVAARGAGGGWAIPCPGLVPACSGGILDVRYSDGGAGRW